MAHVRTRHLDQGDRVAVRPLVDQWVAQHVITPEQAQLMIAGLPAAQTPHQGRQRSSVAAEAAGYLGGSIVVVATILIAAQYWSDLSASVRIGAVGGAALALLVAGRLVSGHGERVGDRMVAVLWLASTAATAGFLALVADTFSALDSHAAPVTAAGTALYVGALWAYRRFLVLQVATAVALMIAVAATISDVSTTQSLPGLGVWVVAATWLMLGWVGRLGPPRAVVTLGSAAMVVGAMSMVPTVEGFALALGTVAAVATLGVVRRDPLLLGVAAVGTLQVLPSLVMEWFPGSELAPFVLLALGVLTVGAAVYAARVRRTPPE